MHAHRNAKQKGSIWNVCIVTKINQHSNRKVLPRKIDNLVRFLSLWKVPKKQLIKQEINFYLFVTVAVTIEVWVTCCLFLLFDLQEMPLISITSVCKGNTALRGLFCDMFDWLMPCSRQTYWIKQSLLVIFENRLHRGLRASQETHRKVEKHCCKINQVLWKSPTGLKPAFPTQQLCNTHSSLS